MKNIIIATWCFGMLAYTVAMAQQNKPDAFEEFMKRGMQEMKSPEMVEKGRRATQRCNSIFEVPQSVEFAPQFLQACHAQRKRKDCLQSSMDWLKCVVELTVPDPSLK